MTLPIAVSRVSVRHIARMRDEYRHEMNCQIVHDSYHERGFTDSYTLAIGGDVVGYASLAGETGKRDVIK